jgi:hypothetical protein
MNALFDLFYADYELGIAQSLGNLLIQLKQVVLFHY